jgi:hypothetical protein
MAPVWGLINDGRSLQQITNTFNILHRPTQCLRCWGFHVGKKGGENRAYKLVNASIVIKSGKKWLCFWQIEKELVNREELLLMPSCCSSTLAVVSGVGGQLLRGSSVSVCTWFWIGPRVGGRLLWSSSVFVGGWVSIGIASMTSRGGSGY